MTGNDRHDRPDRPQPGPEPEQGTENLDAVFAALRAREPEPAAPSEVLLARVLADAEAELRKAARPAPAPFAQRPAAPVRVLPRLLARARLPAGLAAALMVGVWIGVAAPAPVLQLEEALFGPQPLAGLVEPAELFAE
jgi:hypothetical protein